MEQPKKHLILIVDDTVEIRTILTLSLSAHGFEVVEACNGKEGIKMAEKINPDIIVSDFMMPEMNGIDAAAILKWKPHTQHIPIIILSSFPFGRNTIRQMNDIGIDAYMMKPYELDELLAKILELLGLQTDKLKKVDATHEGRKSKRFPPMTLAQVEIAGESYMTQIQNVSREGMSLLLSKHEHVGTVLTISINPNLDLTDEKSSTSTGAEQNQYTAEKILGKAKIMWIQPQKENQFLAGVEILSLEI